MGNAGKGGKGKLSVDDAVTCWKRKTTTRIMKLADDDDDMDEDLLKLFDLEELEGYLAELMDDIAAKDKTVKEGTYEQLLQKLQPSAALRLLNFLGLGGKEYTILRPLQTVLLVGKEDPDDYTRRMLLTEEQQREVLPRLEEACREELEGAGFFLADAGDESR